MDAAQAKASQELISKQIDTTRARAETGRGLVDNSRNELIRDSASKIQTGKMDAQQHVVIPEGLTKKTISNKRDKQS